MNLGMELESLQFLQIYIHKDETFKWKCNLFHYNYFSLVLR